MGGMGWSNQTRQRSGPRKNYGILWCEHCGKRYRPGASKRVYRYRTKDGVEHRRTSDTLRLRYICNGGTKAGCPRPTMYARSIETLVWNAVSDFISRPEQVKTLLAARQSDLESGGTLENVVKARERLSRMEDERGRTLTASAGIHHRQRVRRPNEGSQRAD